MTSERRLSNRFECLWPATLLYDGEWHECFIINISIGGAKLECFRNRVEEPSFDPEERDEVILNLGPYGQYNGLVVWLHDKCYGLSFTHPPENVRQQALGRILNYIDSCATEWLSVLHSTNID